MSVKDLPIPKDTKNIAFFILFLHGIGFLLPWNVFINARSYFIDYKLNTTTSYDADYRTNFLNYVGFAAQFPSVIFAALNTFYQSSGGSSGNTTKRFLVAMILEIIILFFTIILALIDTSNVPEVFFALTIISVIIINCCVGIHQTLTFGLAANMPMKYSNAVVIGSNACGTVVSIVNILTKAGSKAYGESSTSVKIATISYFASALVIVVACLATYFTLFRLEFVRYYMSLDTIEVSDSIEDSPKKESLNGKENEVEEVNVPLMDQQKEIKIRPDGDGIASDESNDLIEESAIPIIKQCCGCCCIPGGRGKALCRNYWSRYLVTFKECWVHCFSVWLVFFCTLSVFPSLQAKVIPNDESYFIPSDWFADVTCFLFFNFFAMLGCIVSNYVQFPKPRFLWIPVVIRCLFFIPFFMVSNLPAQERYYLPTLITNDHVYVLLSIVFAFTNGYFSSLCMMYAPRNSPSERASLAGMLAAFCLVFGVFSGVYASRIFVMLI